MVTKPQWATPQRQAHLVDLFYRSGGFCVFRDQGCQVEAHHYPVFMETCIEEWKAEDREARSLLLKLEQSTIHDGTYGRYGSSFDPVTRDVYYQERPVYYLMGFGVSAASKRRIAVIRVPSTYVRLHVDVADAFQSIKVSKNKRRKMDRYQSGPSAEVWAVVDTLCGEAVAAYWTSKSSNRMG